MHDPFLDLIRLLQPRATLWAGIEGRGRWGVAFRQREDLLLCWMRRGACLLTRPGFSPVDLAPDDFVVIRTSTSFTLTTDASVDPVDSETAVGLTGDAGLRLGPGDEAPVTLRGGRFVFDAANEELLTSLLPPFVHVAASDPSSARVRALLAMNEAESLHPGAGGAFVVARLMELIFVEVLRGAMERAGPEQTGLLAGLADPVTACALTAMHENVAAEWTVASLARRCGVSRSVFAARFRTVVGLGPLAYLQRWRMALAKDALRRGMQTVAEIAFAVGFQSSSAFSTAFTREVGCAPSRYASRAAGSGIGEAWN